CRRYIVQNPNPIFLRHLLRAANGHETAPTRQRNQLPPRLSMTSSARASNVGGIARPRALAALMLTVDRPSDQPNRLSPCWSSTRLHKAPMRRTVAAGCGANRLSGSAAAAPITRARNSRRLDDLVGALAHGSLSWRTRRSGCHGLRQNGSNRRRGAHQHAG